MTEISETNDKILSEENTSKIEISDSTEISVLPEKVSSETEVRILPINKNAFLNSCLPISILPDDPEEKRNLVIKIADFKPIMFEAKPDSDFVSLQPWSSPCPICNRKHGNYGLHGKWSCENGNQLPYDPELAKLYFQDKLEYCLFCNTSSNKFKFAIVA
ncbi:1950_t:CDS:2 [Gigaspora margarita]|uniref:1950_t:CDS:1 n=1 Tax=Gigaspora margarita TaxID=4874 RepID=A0ABN7UHW0_GIGMA|nr:1950_t:CDS:2 [Gigaspora margarita]